MHTIGQTLWSAKNPIIATVLWQSITVLSERLIFLMVVKYRRLLLLLVYHDIFVV